MYMRTAFVTALVASASAFTAPVSVTQPRLRAVACDFSMQMQMDRRTVACMILAAPAAAFAVGGDSPKQAYFSTQPLSSPFGETYTNQNTRLWQELGETEKAIFTRIASKTKSELTDVSCKRLYPTPFTSRHFPHM